jgi:hypothetical protein
MNEIKKQLLNEIKNRESLGTGNEVKPKHSSFPFALNRNLKKDSKGSIKRAKDVSETGIHRATIKGALPTSYRFKPTEFKKDKDGSLVYSANTESGTHQYTIKAGDGEVGVSIRHRTSKKPELKKGSLTTSEVDINLGKNLGTREILDSIIPSILHHIKSVKPDNIKMKTTNMDGFLSKVVNGVSKKYRVSSEQGVDGSSSWTLQSKKITPRIQSLIKALLHK